MVFNTPYGFEGVKSFSGKEMSFEEFKKQYPNAEFESLQRDIVDTTQLFRGIYGKKEVILFLES